MREIRLDDSCLNHLTNIPVGFTRESSYIHNSEKSYTKILCILLTGGAYAPDATCIATPLFQIYQNICRKRMQASGQRAIQSGDSKYVRRGRTVSMRGDVCCYPLHQSLSPRLVSFVSSLVGVACAASNYRLGPNLHNAGRH